MKMVKIFNAIFILVLVNFPVVHASEQQTASALRAILTQFLETRPHRENMREWREIRQSSTIILSLVDENLDKAVDELLSLLMTIYPGRENIREWAAIREVARAQRSSDASARIKLIEIVRQLSVTDPDRENELEWAAIRSVAKAQLRLLQ